MGTLGLMPHERMHWGAQGRKVLGTELLWDI